MLLRPIFHSRAEYGEHFTDPGFWQPYVDEVCRRHSFVTRTGVSGRPGTHPVFLVDGRWVIKFFSDLFEGSASFQVEQEVYRLLEAVPGFPAPRMIASGELFPAEETWRWPYLVSTALPGVSLAEVYEAAGRSGREEAARFAGRWLKVLHGLPLPHIPVLAPRWELFTDRMERQYAGCAERHRAWQDLPPVLIDQIEDYLPPVELLVDRTSSPILLHGDLNADHLLGEWNGQTWRPTGIIDFGDARAGDPLYELVPLQIGLFRGDRRLLDLFLQAYDPAPGVLRDFPHRAMAYTLLFEFELEDLFQQSPRLAAVTTLDEAARMLWGLG